MMMTEVNGDDDGKIEGGDGHDGLSGSGDVESGNGVMESDDGLETDDGMDRSTGDGCMKNGVNYELAFFLLVGLVVFGVVCFLLYFFFDKLSCNGVNEEENVGGSRIEMGNGDGDGEEIELENVNRAREEDSFLLSMKDEMARSKRDRIEPVDREREENRFLFEMQGEMERSKSGGMESESDEDRIVFDMGEERKREIIVDVDVHLDEQEIELMVNQESERKEGRMKLRSHGKVCIDE